MLSPLRPRSPQQSKPRSQPPSQPPPSREDPASCEVLLVGRDATLSVLRNAVVRAGQIYEHARPTVPADFNPDGMDITKLSMRQVGQALQYYVGMLAYATCEAAKADQEAEFAEHSYRSLYGVELLRHDNGEQKYKLEAVVAALPAIQALRQTLLQAKAMRELTKATLEGLRAKSELASREITRRQFEFELSRRNAGR